MFLFEQMFNTALNGINTAGLMSNIIIVAYGVLLASLLFSAYEAWVRGGDVRSLGVSAAKYLAVGLLFVNGGALYDSVFRAIVGSFNQLAHAMAGVGPTDVFAGWLAEIRSAADNSATFLNLVTGVISGLLSAVLLLVAMILYPVAYTIFAVLYSLFGTILYVVGPLVLSVLPALGLGNLARRYAVNVFVFASWGLLYGIFCRLAMALNIHSMAAIIGAGSFGGALQGATAEVLLAAASILFSVCILLIPFLAKRVVEGDLGSTMLMVLGTTAAMAQAAASSATGAADGYSRTASSGSRAGGGSVPSAGAPPSPASPAPVTPSAPSHSTAPAGPNAGAGTIGHHRPVNIPHAVGWLAGAAAALGVQGGQRIIRAVRAAGSTRNSE